MATGRSCIRLFLQPAAAPPIQFRAVASMLAATSDAAVTNSVTNMPTTTSASTSPASATAAATPVSSGSTSRYFTRSVVPGFGWDSLATTPSTARASPTARAATSTIGSSSCTAAAASVGSWSTGTAQVRTACPTLIGTAVSRFGSGPHTLAAATRTPTARAYGGVSSSDSGRGFSSSATNGEEAPSDASSSEEEDPAAHSWAENRHPNTDAYFFVIGQILQTVHFSEGELRYLSDIISKKLQQHDKPVESSLAKTVDLILKVQSSHGEQIDKLWVHVLSKEKPEKSEWFKVKVFGHQLDLSKLGTMIRVLSMGSGGPP